MSARIFTILLLITGFIGSIPSASALEYDYLPGRLSLRMADQPLETWRTDAGVTTQFSEINRLLSDFSADRIEPLLMFTLQNPDRVAGNPDLSYIVVFPEDTDMELMGDLFSELPMVEYAEPDYLLPFYRTPNDPFLGNQWYHTTLESELAWDSFEDNSDIIIAIVDSGVEWYHPDLRDNLWVNPGEDLDGDGVAYEDENWVGDFDDLNNSDDNSNGLIDDLIGYDFMTYGQNCADGEDCNTADNNPDDFDGHGTHCSGLASAATNNEVGIASVAWNATIMPLRAGYHASDGMGYIPAGAAANAMYYAVDNDANIISLSFGGSSTTRTAANYAWNSGLLCFHAAGNDDANASDELDSALGMVSVAATANGDSKASFSNYGSWVDVSAPGENMYSTYPYHSYTPLQGTSMACPLAASVAAFIWGIHPEYTNEEVRYQLMYTADNIDFYNPDHEGMLGTGRVNAYNAVNDIFPTVISMGDIHVTDDVDGGNGDLRYLPGETFGIWTELFNDGVNVADNATISVACDDPDITITNPDYVINALQPYFSEDNEASPILLDIAADAEPHHITLTVSFGADNANSGSYEYDVQIGAAEVLLYDYDGLEGSDELAQYYVSFLAQSGFNTDWYDLDTDAFPMYNGFSLDFGNYSAVIFYTGVRDETVPASILNTLEDYLTNGGNVLFSGQHLIQNIEDDAFVSSYLGCEPSESMTSNRLLSGAPGTVWEGNLVLLQGNTGAGNQVIPMPLLNLTTGEGALRNNGTESDWLAVQTHGDNWNAIFCAFSFEAIGGGGTTLDIGECFNLANTYFGQNEVQAQPDLRIPEQLALSAYPNPFNPSTTLEYNLPLAGYVTLSIYDMLGRQVITLVEGNQAAGTHQIAWDASAMPSGIYFSRLSTGQSNATAKLLLVK